MQSLFAQKYWVICDSCLVSSCASSPHKTDEPSAPSSSTNNAKWISLIAVSPGFNHVLHLLRVLCPCVIVSHRPSEKYPNPDLRRHYQIWHMSVVSGPSEVSWSVGSQGWISGNLRKLKMKVETRIKDSSDATIYQTSQRSSDTECCSNQSNTLCIDKT